MQWIQAQWHEDAPRLIFADFLDERHDPRGELIRVQCALARMAADDRRRKKLRQRESELLHQYAADWLHPLKGIVSDAQFRRGLLESVSMSGRDFFDHGEILRQIPSLRRLRLYDAASWMGRILQRQELSQLRELDLCGNDLGNGTMTLLARAPFLERLEILDLSVNSLTSEGVRQLMQADWVARLTELHLNDNGRIADAGVDALARNPRLRRLHTLDLSGNDLSDGAVRMLSESPHLKRLNRLMLHQNHIGDMGIHWLLSGDLWHRLMQRARVLNLEESTISLPGIQELVNSPRFRQVESLDLSGNLFGDRGIQALARSDNALRLRHLRIRKNRLSDDAALAIADAPWLAQLESLDMSDNAVTKEAIEIIRESPYFHWRLKLDLDEHPERLPDSSRLRRNRRPPPHENFI
ncbi:Leucine-rich repeat-containing protein typical subtype OS=Herpetosiphon aurantiacus (strain ATCC 23779 / DSM 785) GN=Haur_4051 PE=4 SV=1: LRR_6: LRR_6: LRR_6: LRR_6: LRR_6: LRR_6: LRR_6 [Tuwongella immobilis]|uniref:Leucine Rich repeats (2 copies) n=1 Tax=Tuwongella immobilis TaxID=692036 RepID=A0A6C2YVB2_9BACT|nr:Leucine-rich repeat-containing protein typical subtype OS=Herpetosiphon aurantiacus (strain ATCC 23779 / DSM 785) GN=Haur_4051 PE=4 SV=1: LRR_6: LRR_6: LRR_6: LRR_6: LRR_6: LRR_6: LRR_6 [Tuwongella immobilis]VTS08228.1 Leucine-rich repeat-containing protein typical subtype OS=Herpetosiphon aurantiacus (strain ATCC 23779 / DSM 785) GN=Haur_4051 PE=4 SV=1: LRR_6: LRR_6: LRR_6: LRR_6: LRR_6: LRR_6: LRR_6 [Tuwongella immobilis]